MLPQLRRLEKEFADALVVIGVHAGKFTTERLTPQIRLAAERLGVTHPIVNDRQFRTWRRYAVQAWPTLVFIAPSGHYLGLFPGEAPYEGLHRAVAELIADGERRGDLIRGAPFGDAPRANATPLRFPSTLISDGDGGVVVADTGHHRVLVARWDEAAARLDVELVIGRGERGREDGVMGAATFASPHGLALDGKTLYVADTGNHLIRAVDLEAQVVRTVAGTGERTSGGVRRPMPARSAELASPWALAPVGRKLYVAMAGSHQLWSMDLAAETVEPFAGSGAESIDDGIVGGATLAQPSGLAVAGDRLYFVDAESSAVRWADLATSFGEKSVHTVVGTGLFDFGDRDGVGDEVRLQHPSAIVRRGERLLIADTYNHRVKLVDPDTRRVTTLTSGEAAGGYNEPEGLVLIGDRLLVSDTNAHRIVAVSLNEDSADESSTREVTIHAREPLSHAGRA